MERLGPDPNVDFSFRKSHVAADGYEISLVDQFQKVRGDVSLEVERHLERVETSLERQKKSAQLGSFAVKEAAARAFYDTMLRPYLLKGTLHGGTKEKTFVPDQQYVDDFIHRLCEDGAASHMYVRLLQSRPGEQPNDTRVSFAALELLRTWSIRALIAKELGLNYGVNIIDETEAFDPGDAIGFTSDAVAQSHDAMARLLDENGVRDELFKIMRFDHQAKLYRGEERDELLGDEYDKKLITGIESTKQDLRLGIFSLNAIRAVMIHKLRRGDGFTNVSANTDMDYLSNFEPDEVAESLHISESFMSALEMREAAKRHVGQLGLQAAFPEFYGERVQMHTGISKSASRLSIQPNFKLLKGRLMTPGYSLPIYNGDATECLGLTSYNEHLSESYKVIYGPNGLPAALIKEDAM